MYIISEKIKSIDEDERNSKERKKERKKKRKIFFL
jgi:hypothetical protein